MDLARTIPGSLAVFASRRHAVFRHRQPGRALGRIRATLAEFRSRPDAKRSRPRNGIQDAEIWDLQQSAVAIDAAPRQPWQLSSRANHHAAAAARRAAHLDRPDAFLSRARRRRQGIALSPLWKRSAPSPG